MLWQRCSAFVVAAMLILSTQMAFAALSVSTGGSWGPYQSGQGGEFTLTPNSDLSFVLANYAEGVTKNVPGGNGLTGFNFQSFCLENSTPPEYIYQNTTYNVAISNKAIYGGVGPAGDPISTQTAWLYSQFASGNLFTTHGYTHAQAGALQQAFWFLEGENGGANNSWVALANANANGTLYGVEVLNLTKADGTLCQDQLVFTGRIPPSEVPIPAAAWLRGSGLVGLVGVRRRMNS
jgi:hypothetical protein